MEGYLGTFPCNISETEFANYTPTDWAMYWIGSYGQIDGAHHKSWVLDQVARILSGTEVIVEVAKWNNGSEEYRITLTDPSEKYKEWVLEMKGEEVEDGNYEYDYDEGIAP